MQIGGWLVVLGVAAVLGFAVRLLLPYFDDSWLDPRRQKHRLTELSIRAATSGLNESAETAVGVRRIAPEGKQPTITLAGRYQGRHVAVGEYRYAPESRSRMARRKKREAKYSAVVSVRLEQRQPDIVVISRDIDATLWNTMVDKAPTGPTEPRLGRVRFDEAYRISTADPEQARQVLHPRVTRTILRHRSVQAWIIAGHDLLGVRYEQLDPHTLMPKIGTIRLVADLLDHPDRPQPHSHHR